MFVLIDGKTDRNRIKTFYQKILTYLKNNHHGFYVGVSEPIEGEELWSDTCKQAKAALKYAEETKQNVKIYDRAVMYIKANYQKGISLGSIAQEIHVSPYYLSKLFRKYTGKICTELIAEERIEAAKMLLSQNYFLKIFKKYVGVTPGEYRNTNMATSTK